MAELLGSGSYLGILFLCYSDPPDGREAWAVLRRYGDAADVDFLIGRLAEGIALEIAAAVTTATRRNNVADCREWEGSILRQARLQRSADLLADR